MTVEVAPLAAPAAVPYGRGRWRLTLHRRQFTALPWAQTIIAELTDARGRQVVQAWDTPAQLTFTLDGRSSQAPLVLELATDVIAWRWDEKQGRDVAVFRGIIDHSEDQVTTESSTVTFVAHDYLAILARRILTAVYTRTATDQDTIVTQLVAAAVAASSSSGTSFTPGSYLPLTIAYLNGDGTARTAGTGQLRDRTYTPSTQIGQSIDDLAKVINGFDYDCVPGADTNATADTVRLFYPAQGVTRTDLALMYGSTVSALTRTVSSSDYANYQRVLGNNGSSDPAAAQFYAEAWNIDANNVTVNPVGLWQAADNAADVNIQSTLNDKANGDLNYSGLLVPTYTVTMRPGAYAWGAPNMGDTVPLYVRAGRLNVRTSTRVLGITYNVGDDGDETVELVLGRPPSTLARLFTQADRDVDALTRR
jgi:hypothetical protein